MIKHLTPLFVCTVLLTACGATTGSNERTYQATFTETGAERQEDLIRRVQTVIERRTNAIEGMPADITVDVDTDGNPLYHVTVEAAESADMLTDHLTKKYTLDLMRVAEPGETPDMLTNTIDDFVSIGFNQNDVEWVEHGTDDEGKGMVKIVFHEEARERLRTFFTENTGVQIGLFVRDGLIAIYTIAEDGLKDNIVITGIPDVLLAEIFADDANVGIHTTFTPLP